MMILYLKNALLKFRRFEKVDTKEFFLTIRTSTALFETLRNVHMIMINERMCKFHV